jgi:hypothetical protein
MRRHIALFGIAFPAQRRVIPQFNPCIGTGVSPDIIASSPTQGGRRGRDAESFCYWLAPGAIERDGDKSGRTAVQFDLSALTPLNQGYAPNEKANERSPPRQCFVYVSTLGNMRSL